MFIWVTDYSNKVTLIGLSSLFIGLVLFVSSIIIAQEITEHKETYKQTEKHNIVAFQDTSTIEGRFYLGSGKIDNSMYYCYYIKIDDEYKYQQLKVTENISIKYIDENEQPYIEKLNKYTMPTSDKKWGWVFNPILISPSERCSNLHPQKIIIYLPEGTIAENYKIDLQ